MPSTAASTHHGPTTSPSSAQRSFWSGRVWERPCPACAFRNHDSSCRKDVFIEKKCLLGSGQLRNLPEIVCSLLIFVYSWVKIETRFQGLANRCILEQKAKTNKAERTRVTRMLSWFLISVCWEQHVAGQVLQTPETPLIYFSVDLSNQLFFWMSTKP